MADVPVQLYRSTVVKEGTQPSNPGNVVGEVFPPVNPPGTGFTTLYKLLGDVTDTSFVGKNGFVPVVVGENLLTLQPLPQITENGLISGGIVQWTGTGYVFNVSSAFYRIGGDPYSSNATQVTLATPDPTNDRIDVFAVDNTGTVVVITGTPAVTPVKPQIDPQTQLELTSVIVTAASVIPILTEEVIYDQNIEWTGTSSGTGTADFASTADPFQGSVSVETTNIQSGFYIQFNNSSTIDISTYQTLGFQLKLKAALGANQNIYAIFLDGSGNPASNIITLSFDKSSTAYQFVGLVLSSVSFITNDIQYIRFNFVRTGGSPTYSGYFLDIVKFEGGINPPVQFGTFLSLGDTPNSYSGQGGKMVAVKADESGLEFVTGTGGGLPPIDGSYASQAAMIADQGNQTAQYIYYDSTEYWEYLGTTTPSIADYRALSSGGGRDNDAVHFDAPDGKNATEKQQARDNIGLDNGISMSVGGGVITRTSNFIIITSGASVTGIDNTVTPVDGEIIYIVNRTGVSIFININNFADNRSFRLDPNISTPTSLLVPNNKSTAWRYDSNVSRWITKDLFLYNFGGEANGNYIFNGLNTFRPANSGLTNQFLIQTLGGSTIFGVMTGGVGTGWFRTAMVVGSGAFDTSNLILNPNGTIRQNRSSASDQSVRRDENFLNTSVNVVTVGSINNQSITAGNFNQRFTLATELTGHANGENGRELTINNANTVDLVLRHESASSTASNRYFIIGAADLTIPTRGIVTLIYNSTVSRWELKSKNF